MKVPSGGVWSPSLHHCQAVRSPNQLTSLDALSHLLSTWVRKNFLKWAELCPAHCDLVSKPGVSGLGLLSQLVPPHSEMLEEFMAPWCSVPQLAMGVGLPRRMANTHEDGSTGGGVWQHKGGVLPTGSPEELSENWLSGPTQHMPHQKLQCGLLPVF